MHRSSIRHNRSTASVSSRLSHLVTCALLLALPFTHPAPAIASGQQEIEAIQRLLEEYRRTQDAGDLIGQSKLMTPDRVWINQTGTRRTDNAENMRIQQAQADALRKWVPNLQQITMDRDLLVKFYGDGTVAVASFYRTAFRLLPPDAPEKLRSEPTTFNETGTLVLEKKNGVWKIVHTHWSGNP